MTTKDKVNGILKAVKPAKNLEGVDDIIEGGYLDSFELMALIPELSEEFGIEVSVEEITPDNFNSVDGMVAMVERLRKG